ncbi:flavodoxin [Brachyspira sp.]|uniref:flavodoxin n=1 Tax=Brachyspira sp. TaxID=1977261 RepID=UPI003D7CB590
MTKRIIIFLTSLIFFTGAFLNAQANKTLVVYFSYSGNTRVAAEYVREILNADIFEIIPANRYPNDYNAAVEQYRREKESSTLPRLANSINVSQYDTIILGYPNWGSDLSLVVKSFLSSNNFSGKRIVPLCTHGGGGFAESVNSIRELCPNSTILEGFSIYGREARNSKNNLQNWLNRIL